MAKKDNLNAPVNTPLMEQYNGIKSKYPDYILFFRLGDFYEMFGADAVVAAPLLGVVLTQRQGIPMCGVPHHAASNYIKILLSAGKKIAICEQQEAAAAKKLIDREVVRLITPGTVWEENLIDSTQNNFLVSVFGAVPEELGYSVADISTSELYVSETTGENIFSELVKIKPKEIILPESWKNKPLKRIVGGDGGISVSYVPDWHYDRSHALAEIRRLTGINSWKALGLETRGPAVESLGGMISYLKQIQFSGLKDIITAVKYKHDSKSLHLDSSAVKNLEIISNIATGGKENTLLDIMEKCRTPMGSRLLRAWLLEPSIDIGEITMRHQAVEYFYENTHIRNRVIDALKKIGDMERILTRLTAHSASPREIWHLGNSIKIVGEIKKIINDDLIIAVPALIQKTLGEIAKIDDVTELIANSINPENIDSGYIKPGYNKTLDEYRRMSEDTRSVLLDLEKNQRARTGINSLKIGYNSVYGYYIEVSKPNLPLVPPDYIRKQTLTNAERFVIPELGEIEKKIYYARQKIDSLEKEILSDIRAKILSRRSEILAQARAVAIIDVLVDFAEISVQNKWTRPSVNESDIIDIKESRHPVVEKKLKTGEFIPNDIYLDSKEFQIIVLTGPNMAGKSTYLRQAALCVIMAQSGCFVPAASASIGVVDKIFTRIGSADNLAGGESTFMVEMMETANILRNMTPRSLLILDEIGRGTSTFDGISIAQATIEYLHKKCGKEDSPNPIRPKVLFATHYFELTELAEKLPRVKNFNVKVSEWNNEIVFMHKIVPGAADRSYGIHVAKIAGIPDEIIDRSRCILSELQSQSHAFTKKDSIPVQADFEDFVIFDKLKRVDIDKTTPIEAINILADLAKHCRKTR